MYQADIYKLVQLEDKTCFHSMRVDMVRYSHIFDQLRYIVLYIYAKLEQSSKFDQKNNIWILNLQRVGILQHIVDR